MLFLPLLLASASALSAACSSSSSSGEPHAGRVAVRLRAGPSTLTFCDAHGATLIMQGDRAAAAVSSPPHLGLQPPTSTPPAAVNALMSSESPAKTYYCTLAAVCWLWLLLA